LGFSFSGTAVTGLLGFAELAGMGVMMLIGRFSFEEGNCKLTIGLEDIRSLHSSGNLTLTSDTEASSTG